MLQLPGYCIRTFSRYSNCLRHSRGLASMSDVTAGKRAAAVAAVNEWIKDKQTVGIGSGSTIVFAVERIAERVKNEGLCLKCVPTSFQARQLILDHGLGLVSLEEYPELDVAIDGADELDPKLCAIKGGGGCLTQEKIVAAAAKSFVVIADNSKESSYLCEKWKKGIPIEVIPLSYKSVKLRLEKRYGGCAELRLAKCKAGPVITDNGNLILDYQLPLELERDWSKVSCELIQIPGIVETGLFTDMVSKAYIGSPNGSVKIIQ